MPWRPPPSSATSSRATHGCWAASSTATVAGNAPVAGTEPVDPRMVHALGDSWAHCVSQLAHAAPAVTMVLFAHLAGLLVGSPPAARRDGGVATRYRATPGGAGDVHPGSGCATLHVKSAPVLRTCGPDT